MSQTRKENIPVENVNQPVNIASAPITPAAAPLPQPSPTVNPVVLPSSNVNIKARLANGVQGIFWGNVSYTKLAAQSTISGVVSASMCFIIDKYIFEYQQKNPKNIMAASKAIWGKLSAGFGATLLNAVSKQTATFMTRQWSENTLNALRPGETQQNRFVANFCGGMLGALATYPLSVIKARRMNQDKQVLSFTLLYRGVIMTATRDTLHWGLLFGVQDAMKAFFDYTKDHPDALLNQLPLQYLNGTIGFGVISGFTTAFFTNGVANIASRQKTTGLSAMPAAKQIISESGLKGLALNGLFFIVPRIIIQATVVKAVGDYLDPYAKKLGH